MNDLKELLLGYNSDSACFEITHVVLLIVLLSFVTRGSGRERCIGDRRVFVDMWFSYEG